MQSPNFVFDKDVPKEDVDPGIKRQILSHSDDIMLVKATFETGAEGYMHEHYHSQIAYIESGVFDVTVDGETKRLKAGDSFLMTPHVMHGAICIEAGGFRPSVKTFLKIIIKVKNLGRKHHEGEFKVGRCRPRRTRDRY